MRTRSLVLLTAASALALPALIPGAAAAPPGGGPAEKNARTTEVQILALNDFHGQLRPPDSTSSGGRIGATPAGGAEFLAQYVRDLEATNPNSLFVSAGDLIGATPLVSAIFHDEPTIEAMNLMGLDYNGVGNHEFDEGPEELVRMQEGGCHPVDGCLDGDGFDGADFPFLAANVTYKDSGKTIFPPYAIHKFQGVKVGVVGMTLEGTPGIVTAAATANLDFHDEADSVNALVPELKKAGVETIIVLLHEGGSAGVGLNESTINSCANPTGAGVEVIKRFNPEIDLVVTGHTNWALNCPDLAGTGIMVTGAASAGRLVTDIDLTISRATKEVVAAGINNVIVKRDVFAPAADLTALIAKYGEIAAPIENRVLGQAPQPLTRTQNSLGESSLGDIIADGQLWATSGANWPAANGAPAVISFMNSGGIRADINVGPITFGEAFSVQPFANVLVTMDMTGADIDAVLELQQNGGNGVLQIPASLTYDRSLSAAPGDRISNVRINGVPLDPAATYRVTVNNFLADGGDGFSTFRNGTNRFVGEIDLDAFARYVEFLGTVNPGPQNRITAVP
ncbi:5'-nucleotidase [Knoellia sinensis KCTC 19936]|uniref:5'-nucleotidase n=1 Tax=Knoellia sinensis KCTC 19936 TaxID=1385520 RepID=A0A0A0JDB2_9MICO|nr:bifunctional metallophosphatase/5'-nucleotidase [Knoellia sinensis]KGN34809.1 5'-nucleotidase [Knoellia sinensis KCTC 19936]